jgi:hypothetical protein
MCTLRACGVESTALAARVAQTQGSAASSPRRASTDAHRDGRKGSSICCTSQMHLFFFHKFALISLFTPLWWCGASCV